MRYCAVLLATLLLVGSGLAGQNPDIRVYLDFDPPSGVDRIDPDVGTFFNVYILLDCFGPAGGCRGVALAFERTFGGVLGAQVNLLGGLDFGNVEDAHIGWVYAAGADCVYPDSSGILVTAYVTYYYTGPPGWLRILRTEIDQGLTVDCDFEGDYFCIAGHAGVGADPPAAEVCSCGTSAVRSSSWGTMKALYR